MLMTEMIDISDEDTAAVPSSSSSSSSSSSRDVVARPLPIPHAPVRPPTHADIDRMPRWGMW